MNIIESGPAGGVIGAQALARALQLPKIITFDMGGTTAKASMVEDGEVTRAPEYSVGGGIMIGSRLLTGAGYMLKVPAIDLAEVGAGGGSHRLDRRRRLAAGRPGQRRRRRLGRCATTRAARCRRSPTPTSCSATSTRPTWSAVRVQAQRRQGASGRSQRRSREPLGLSLEHAAYGAHQIAASNMIRAIKAVSTERGRDPREFALFAFGGNGPLFAAAWPRRCA